jgi:HPt (histidine-containing phosphotransfer) domain-containing protein
MSSGNPTPPTNTTAEQTEAQKKLHDLLATMWEQRKSVVLDRLHVLEQAISALEVSSSEESRKSGADASHKLAGILGTFGLPRGTDLAREAEVTLEKDGPLSADDLLRLRRLAEELGLLIHQRSLPGGR